MAASSAAIAVLALASAQLAIAQQWQTGRATFYGKDDWSIHTGSCGYTYLDELAGTGWDVAAVSDSAHDYRGSCGKCKEVRCKNMKFKDGYGQQLDRNGVCFDPAASLVVTVTDTCQCSYPGNFFSNKRWCCGDMYHMDLSIWAYEKLSDTKWGVIGIEWRDVPCSYRPNKRAKNPWGKRSSPDRSKPRGWKLWFDHRSKLMNASGRRLKGITQK